MSQNLHKYVININNKKIMLRMTNDYKEETITTLGKLGNLKFENMPKLLLLQKKIVELFLA
jgi:hypothetical protein